MEQHKICIFSGSLQKGGGGWSIKK